MFSLSYNNCLKKHFNDESLIYKKFLWVIFNILLMYLYISMIYIYSQFFIN